MFKPHTFLLLSCTKESNNVTEKEKICRHSRDHAICNVRIHAVTSGAADVMFIENSTIESLGTKIYVLKYLHRHLKKTFWNIECHRCLCIISKTTYSKYDKWNKFE